MLVTVRHILEDTGAELGNIHPSHLQGVVAEINAAGGIVHDGEQYQLPDCPRFIADGRRVRAEFLIGDDEL